MKLDVKALMIPFLVGLGLVAGLLREVFLAYLFGTSREIEVFRVASGLPSILSESLAVSFVSVLIPVLLADPRALSLRQATWAAGIVGSAIFTVGALTMTWQAQIFAPGITGGDRVALIYAGRLCWVMFLLIILSLPLRAYMSAEYRIWPGASAALLRSAAFVFALGAAVAAGAGLTAINAAWAMVLAGLTVLAVHFGALGPARWRQIAAALRAGPGLGHMRPIVVALGLVFGTQLLLSGGRILDRAVASNMAEGTIAAIEYSYAFLMAMAALIGTSANIFLAPRIAWAIRNTGHMPRRYWKAIAGVTVLAIMAGITMALFASMLIRVVLEYGAFGPDDTALTVRVLRIHAMALGPLVLALVLTQVLILSGGQRWLVPIAATKLVIKVVGLWGLINLGWGLEGIAISLGVAELGVAAALGLALVARGQSSKHAQEDL